MTVSKLEVHTSRINEFIQILRKNLPTLCCNIYNRIYLFLVNIMKIPRRIVLLYHKGRWIGRDVRLSVTFRWLLPGADIVGDGVET